MTVSKSSLSYFAHISYMFRLMDIQGHTAMHTGTPFCKRMAALISLNSLLRCAVSLPPSPKSELSWGLWCTRVTH